MKDTVTEIQQVEKEREVIICDYCRLVTSEDLDDGEEFGTVTLNATVRTVSSGRIDNLAHIVDSIDDRGEIKDALRNAFYKASDFVDKADLCPGCQEALFGDSPDSMLRTKVDQ